jgi:hypothetical protein
MKISLLLAIALLVFSCQSNRTNKTVESTDSLHNIGGTKDKNGCLIAAGYTWSQLKNNCIQPFTDAISLDILNTTNSYQTAAFILLDSVQRKAEIFVSEEDESIILDQSNDTLYSNGKFRLTKENFCWTLSLNKIKLYQERK